MIIYYIKSVKAKCGGEMRPTLNYPISPLEEMSLCPILSHFVSQKVP